MPFKNSGAIGKTAPCPLKIRAQKSALSLKDDSAPPAAKAAGGALYFGTDPTFYFLVKVVPAGESASTMPAAASSARMRSASA